MFSLRAACCSIRFIASLKSEKRVSDSLFCPDRQGNFFLKEIKVVIARGIHLFPFRTEKLSLVTPMVLLYCGRVGSRRFLGIIFFQEGAFSEKRMLFFRIDTAPCRSLKAGRKSRKNTCVRMRQNLYTGENFRASVCT